MRSQDEEKLHAALNDLLLCHIVADKSVMGRHGLRRVRFYMLRHLYQNPGISPTRLSELSFADAGSISRMIFGFEKEGMVERQPEGEDRRKYVLSLTATGKAFYEKVEAELTADIQKRFSRFETEQLHDILQRVQTLSDAIMQSIHSKNETGVTS